MAWTKITLSAAVIMVGAASPSFAADYASSVEKILMQQKEILELDATRQKEMIACVVNVTQVIPEPTRIAIAEASSVSQAEDEFGKAVMADHAKIKQEITEKCGEIVTEKK